MSREETGRATDGDGVRAYSDQHDGDDTMSTFRKILVPTGYSRHAREAFRVADDLARPTAGSVVMFHASRFPALLSDGERLPSSSPRGEAKDVQNEVGQVHAKVPAVRVEHEIVVADRPAAKHILGIVRQRGCDVIVMGTRVQTGRKRRLFDRVTEEVVRRAHCPVIVVTAPAREPAQSAHETADQPADRVKS
jgi:nucleotide-binding universal stress UspA family protein